MSGWIRPVGTLLPQPKHSIGRWPQPRCSPGLDETLWRPQLRIGVARHWRASSVVHVACSIPHTGRHRRGPGPIWVRCLSSGRQCSATAFG